jgi:hypothetical protein
MGEPVINPLQDPDFLTINSINELMKYTVSFGERVATTTATYAFCRQVFGARGIQTPWKTSPQYRKEPDYEVEYRGPNPIGVLRPFGGPVYRWSGQDGQAYIKARQAYAICAAHMLPDFQEKFKKNSNLSDHAEMMWEHRRMEVNALQYQKNKRTQSLSPSPLGENRKDFQYHTQHAPEDDHKTIKELHDEYAKLPWTSGDPLVEVQLASPTISEGNSDIMPFLLESADAALDAAIRSTLTRDERNIADNVIVISDDEEATSEEEDDEEDHPLVNREDLIFSRIYNHKSRGPGLTTLPFREY